MAVTRRELVAWGAVMVGWSRPALAAPHGLPKTVALDWGAAATVVALGGSLLGVPVPSWYRRIVVDPPLPATCVDVGLLNAPNFELLQALAPTLILISPGLASMQPLLTRIARIETVFLQKASREGLPAIEAETRRLASLLGLQAEAERLISDTRQRLMDDKAASRMLAGQAILFGTVVDDRHVLVFGRSSLIGHVADRLGLTNAGQALVPNGADQAIVGWEAIAGLPIERFVGIAPDTLAPGIAFDDPLLRALTFLHGDRCVWIGPVYQAGGLPAVARLSRLLCVALDGTARKNG